MTLEETKLDGCNIEKFLDFIQKIILCQKQDEGWDDYFVLSYVSDELNSILRFCKEQKKKFTQKELDRLTEFKEQLFKDFPNDSRASRDVKHAILNLINQLAPKKEEGR